MSKKPEVTDIDENFNGEDTPVLTTTNDPARPKNVSPIQQFKNENSLNQFVRQNDAGENVLEWSLLDTPARIALMSVLELISKRFFMQFDDSTTNRQKLEKIEQTVATTVETSMFEGFATQPEIEKSTEQIIKDHLVGLLAKKYNVKA